MLQLRLGRDDAALSRRTEHLLKVQALPLIGQIENFIGMVILHTLHNGGEVGGGIERCAVGLHEDARWNLLLIALFRNGNDLRALALLQNALRL